MYEFTHRLPHQPWAKPSRNEEEYFHRLEFEERMKRARAHERSRQASERAMSAELHRDCCPKCGSALQHIRVKEGEADQCPSCLGVWLGYDMFAALTHPAGGYLQDIFRTLVLEYSMGEIPGPEKKEDEAADA